MDGSSNCRLLFHEGPHSSTAHSFPRGEQGQVFGLTGVTASPTRYGFPAFDASAFVVAFVPVYRCGSVPDSHRVPFSGWISGEIRPPLAFESVPRADDRSVSLKLTRRDLTALCAPVLGLAAPRPTQRLLFTSGGKTTLINSDGTGQRVLEFDVPHQRSWQPGPLFADGHRMMLLSIEEGQGQSWKGEARTHWWIHDLRSSGAVKEVTVRNPPAPYFIPCCLLPGETELIAQAVAPGNPGDARLYRVALDGSEVRAITAPAQGHHYCASLSPDGKRLAFHVTGPKPHGYRVFACDLDGQNRTLIAGQEGHLYFGVHWSPAGDWLLYQDCLYRQDPGHDWSDICVGRPDGSEHRVLTKGQSQWFAAAWGDPAHHGSGSNVASWTPQGKILYTRKTPGAQPAYQWSQGRPDTDHFNRDFKPGEARGGTEIWLLDPRDAGVTRLTRSAPPVWDWYASASPDGAFIAFCRAENGRYPSIWLMGSEGQGARRLTNGSGGKGAFVSRWLPASV